MSGIQDIESNNVAIIFTRYNPHVHLVLEIYPFMLNADLNLKVTIIQVHISSDKMYLVT